MTLASKIARYVELRDHIAVQTKVFSEWAKPFRAEMEAIEAWLADFLLKTEQDSAKTEFGTAYKKTLVVPKVDDRDDYLNWCLANWDDGGSAMLQIGAPQVTAFREYIDKRQREIEETQANDMTVAPPGTSFEMISKININRG